MNRVAPGALKAFAANIAGCGVLASSSRERSIGLAGGSPLLRLRRRLG